MIVELNIDYEGNPYIACISDGDTNNDNLMEIFNRKAMREGLVIINESGYETSDNYITIRLAKSSNIPLNLKIVKPEEK